MATIYVDLVSGNDGTGDGSAALPYLTINKAIGIVGAPHDIRVAKTTAPATTGAGTNMTWTRGSVTINTSADLSASIAVGDYIGRLSATGNGGTEGWYRVTARAAATITIASAYYGTTGTDSGCLKVAVVTSGTAGQAMATVNVAGHNISGGWNLAGSPARDGATWCKSNNAAGSTVAAFNISTNVTISYFNCFDNAFMTTAAVCNINVSYCSVSAIAAASYILISHAITGTFDHCFINGGNGSYCIQQSVVTGALTISNNVFVGSSYALIYLVIGAGNTITWTNNYMFYSTGSSLYLYAQGQALNGSGNTSEMAGGKQHTLLNVPFNIKIEGWTFKGSNAVVATVGVIGLLIKDCTFDTQTTYAIGSRISELVLQNCTFTNCNYGIDLDAYSREVSLYGCTFTTPTNYGIRMAWGAAPCRVVDCTIDGASTAKAILFQTAVNANTQHTHIIKNSFGLADGIYYPVAKLLLDTTVHSSAPSLKFTYNSAQIFTAMQDIKIFSVYCANATGKTFTFWMKSAAGWAGTITPKFKLNGKLIVIGAVESSVSTSWTQVSYHCHNADVTSAGVLSLEFNITCSSGGEAIYFDDVTITNTGS